MDKKIKKKVIMNKICNCIYFLLFCIIITFLISAIIDNVFYTYKVDESLIKHYDLNKDLIPDPIQKTIPTESFTTKVGNVTLKIDKLATYDITGKVEATKNFNTSKLASILSFQNENNYALDYISPRDLTLSWGKIALNENNGHIYCDQYEATNNGQRFVWYNSDNYLIKKYGWDQIHINVSNNHIITLDKDLKNILLNIKLGDIVRIIGYLVEVNTSGGVKWGPSSMVRTDDGDGACEIILAEDIVIMP